METFSIPIDVLIHVFSFLHLPLVARVCSRVCKNWYTASNSTLLWSKNGNFDKWLTLSHQQVSLILQQPKFKGLESIELDWDTLYPDVFDSLLSHSRHSLTEITICGTRGKYASESNTESSMPPYGVAVVTGMTDTTTTSSTGDLGTYNHMVASKLLDLGFVVCRFMRLQRLRFTCITLSNTNPPNSSIPAHKKALYPLAWLSALSSLTSLEFIRCTNLHLMLPPPLSYASGYTPSMISIRSPNTPTADALGLVSAPIITHETEKKEALSNPVSALSSSPLVIKKPTPPPSLPRPLPPYLATLKIKYSDSLAQYLLPFASWQPLSNASRPPALASIFVPPPFASNLPYSLTHLEVYTCHDTTLAPYLISHIFPYITTLKVLHLSLPENCINFLSVLSSLTHLYLFNTTFAYTASTKKKKKKNINRTSGSDSDENDDDLDDVLSLKSLSYIPHLKTLHLEGFSGLTEAHMDEMRGLHSLREFSVDNMKTFSISRTEVWASLPQLEVFKLQSLHTGPTILFMDSANLSTQYHMVSHVLGYFNYILTSNVNVAFEFFLAGKCDLVLVNLDMRHDAGGELVHKIRAEKSQKPVPILGHIGNPWDSIKRKRFMGQTQTLVDDIFVRPPAIHSMRGNLLRLIPHIVTLR